MSDPWIEKLHAALADCPIVTDPDILAGFARDHAAFAPAGVPAALVRARSREDVIATLRFAKPSTGCSTRSTRPAVTSR